MNQTNSQIQVSDSTNLSPPLITIHSNSRDDNTLTDSQTQTALNYQPPQQTSQITLAQIFTHPNDFFYRPPNDFCHYYVNCKEICYDTVTHLLNKFLKERNIQFNENEYIFYYQQQYDNRFYQVSCEIVSPSLIDNFLNKNFLGIELQQYLNQEYLAFTFDQKINLEYFLKQYLSQYILN